jgi:hypothetical protein
MIRCAHVQEHSSALPGLGEDERAAIPNPQVKIHIADPGKRAFGTERHLDLSRQALRLGQAAVNAAQAGVKLKLPDAVQVKPSLAFHLRTGILRTRDVHS